MKDLAGLNSDARLALIDGAQILDEEKSEELNPELGLIEDAICSAAELCELVIEPRAKLLGDWFREGDLGFVFAPRGVGKTWFALGLAGAIASGSQFGPWPTGGSAASVLYIDGEMPLELIRDRVEMLQIRLDQLLILNHEHLFQKGGTALNLAEPKVQNRISELCIQHGVKALFLDNLSVLFGGLRENEADSWELVLNWLMSLRRQRIAVVIVHHAGRGGKEMRGTSRREDTAFWIIKLEAKDELDEDRNGARFVSMFTKQRNCPGDLAAVEWHFRPSNDKVDVIHCPASDVDIVLEWIDCGHDSCNSIAKDMGISAAKVSKMVKKLIDAGKVRKNGRRYELVEE
ncbi:MAG: AAA family ATPase [Chthoniobacterales bacterium]